jgi:outer membrane protein
MRTTFLAFALLAAGQAHAQFSNRRIGLELSPMRFTDRELTTGLMAMLDGAVYLDDGFEVGLRVPFAMFLTATSNRQRLGTGGQLYARYLFSQESLRPWADLELDVLYIFRDNADALTQQQVFWGPGISAGLDVFVNQSLSIGARGMFTLYVAVNNDTPLRPSYGGTVNAQVYF